MEPPRFDIKNAFYQRGDALLIVGGYYALGDKDVLPNDIAAVFDNLRQPLPKDGLTLGTVDDVTFTSLPARQEPLAVSRAGVTACKFWGMGSNGTAGTNKDAIKIIGDNTPLYAQACFSYDSKRSGGITVSHLRFDDRPIISPYLIRRADFIACSQQSHAGRYDLLEGLEPGGIFLLNCSWSEVKLEQHLPVSVRRYLAQEKIDFYTLSVVDIIHELDLGERFSMLMQAAFFKLTTTIDPQTATDYFKRAVEKSYGNRGASVTEMNQRAIELEMAALHWVTAPAHWATLEAPAPQASTLIPNFIRGTLQPMNRQRGDLLPVSAFAGMEDGTFSSDIAAWEKCGIALEMPVWRPDGYAQCNQCAFVCPHVTIRPALLSVEEQNMAPAGLPSKPAQGVKDHHYHPVVSPLGCSSCGNCVENCSSRGKTLQMVSLGSQRAMAPTWDCTSGLTPKDSLFCRTTVRDNQLETPLLEFSGVCVGYGKTLYARLITQPFGDRMLTANAIGCSLIWDAGMSSMPYTTNHYGHELAWADSLFGDSAELGLNMVFGRQAARQRITEELTVALVLPVSDTLHAAMRQWLAQQDEGKGTRERAGRLSTLLAAEKESVSLLERLWQSHDYFVRRSQWIFGDDGQTYDIGFGSLNYVLTGGEDVNILAFNTEVYSNTDGQLSKSTSVAMITKFAVQGKRMRKKDLGMMAMSYDNVHVAQIVMGADKDQALRTIAEAGTWPGPSLVIIYAAYINHGLKVGMRYSQCEAKQAVEAGYWHLRRYHPQWEAEGKMPFILDSEELEESFRDFLFDEVHYVALHKTTPDPADVLFRQTEDDARVRFRQYQRLAGEEQAIG